jgi:A/G-specific adenine glycosylase
MIFSNTLESWYLKNKRDLPWRKSGNPYYIWLSEIILQQTRVAQGLSYYEKFVSTFPTVVDLANAEESQVLKLWQGLGYYSRARNLHFSAKYIVNELGGVFPDTYKSLLLLKGVGDYTASAISSICFGERAAVVDGNVYRVLSRYFGIATPINSTHGIKEFKALAQELLITDDPGQYNQALMEFGALQCVPQNPNCHQCPLEQSCDAYAKGTIGLLPVKEKKIKIKKRYFNFIVFLLPDEHTVLEKREGKGIWENLFQFPLVETIGTVDTQSLVEVPEFSSLLKGSDFEVQLFNEKEWVHKLSHQHLYTRFWLVSGDSKHQESIPIADIDNYPVPRLIHRFLDAYDFDTLI